MTETDHKATSLQCTLTIPQIKVKEDGKKHLFIGNFPLLVCHLGLQSRIQAHGTKGITEQTISSFNKEIQRHYEL